MYNNAFDNDECLCAFLDRLGLRARVVNQVDLSPDIVSMRVLALPQELLERIRHTLSLWILTPITK
jgi:hypothetical protein